MKKTILIVDDDPAMHEVYGDMFRQSDRYQLARAYSVEEALKGLKTRRIDLILLDIIMEPIPGSYLYLKVARDKKIQNEKIPIIVVSVLKEHELGSLGKLDNLIFFAKPFKKEALMGKIEELLGSD
ncbi:MAG: response regulator [Candidatus Omnitrophota bacterium]